MKYREKVLFTNVTYLNVFTAELLTADIGVINGRIKFIGSIAPEEYDEIYDLDGAGVLVPGFIDAHLHFESTMVLPEEMLKESLRHGTTTYIADPHEAANVAGIDGIQFMLDATENLPANIYFMLPSCVPVTPESENGAILEAEALATLAGNERVLGLGEVMNVQSVVEESPRMMAKLALFKDHIKDGHAPLVSGATLQSYIAKGIANDHETSDADELQEKVRLGMHIHVRESSAAHNLKDIMSAALRYRLPWRNFSFCTDDKAVKEIKTSGHIDDSIRQAVKVGVPPIEALMIASYYTACHYRIDQLTGAIAPGLQADWVLLDNLDSLQVKKVFYKGCETDKLPIERFKVPSKYYHTINCPPLTRKMLELKFASPQQPTILLVPNQLLTRQKNAVLPLDANGVFQPDSNFNKAVVMERHKNTGHYALGVVQGFGLKNAAIATSVAHDDHNLCAIGDNDQDIACSLNYLRQTGGGYVMASNGQIVAVVALPVLGLLSDQSYDAVYTSLCELHHLAAKHGVPQCISPTHTLSFLSLSVIPEIRLTTRGYRSCLADTEDIQ